MCKSTTTKGYKDPQGVAQAGFENGCHRKLLSIDWQRQRSSGFYLIHVVCAYC